MSVSKTVGCFVLLVGWACPFVCSGQTSNAGAVAGTVRAPDGSAIPGASVTLSATDAPARMSISSGDGNFLIRDLPSGSYTIRVTSPSFASDEEVVSVAIGRTNHLSIHLSIASTQQSVNVSAAPPMLDTSQTSSVVNIDRDRVEELPIPSRNYLAFVLLSPQVAAANPALSQQGVIPGGLSFSFGGLRPGSNTVYLDEVSDNDEYTGSSRTQLSPEAISDFQIVNHGVCGTVRWRRGRLD
ncbi:MAG TPA: carboxypeptidase-like regulatory domain-containing protein [Edaphobacter sp.]